MIKHWLIYKHTSKTSGKSYIGLTSTSIERRWIQHISDAKTGSKLHFHNAIRLYGVEDWIHEVVETKLTSLEEANKRELYYIRLYDTFENGYNLTIGGDGGTGRVWTERHREELDATKPVYKFIHYSKGVEELTLLKMVDKYGMSKGTLHGLINGTRQSCYGWQMYEVVGDNPTNFDKEEETITFYHEDGRIEKCTSRELSDKYKLTYSKVTALVRGLSKYVKGWSLQQYELTYRHDSPKSKVRKWYNTDTGITEELSTSAICRKYGLSTGSLTSVAKGRRSSHKGWVLADTVAKQAKAVADNARAEEYLASAELKREQADALAADFVKDATGQKRAEHEMDREYDAAVKQSIKESSKVR